MKLHSLFLHWTLVSYAAQVYLCEAISAKPHFKIVTPASFEGSLMATLARIGPAFDSGMKQLRRYEASFTASHVYLNKTSWTDCGKLEEDIQNVVAKWYYHEVAANSQNNLVIITPGCSGALSLNQLAANWNILLITTTTSHPVIRDKSKSPTWVSTNFYPSLWYGHIFFRILRLYRWTSVYVILDENAVVYYLNGAAVTMRYLKANYFRTVYLAYNSKEKELDFSRILTQMNKETRALIFFGHPPQLRRLLITAHKLNMTNGEFVFIATHLFPGDDFGNFTWKCYDQDDTAMRKAYQSLLLVVGAETKRSDLPSSNQTEEVKEEFVRFYLTNPLYNNIDLRTPPPIPHLMATYSALDILGQVLNDTLTFPVARSDYAASNLAKQFRNRTFSTRVGPVTMDEHGDGTPHCSVKYFDVDSDGFEKYMESEIRNQDFSWILVGNMTWHGNNHPPIGEPLCGYRNEWSSTVCISNMHMNTTTIWAVSTTSAILVGILCVVLLYARRAYHNLVDEPWNLNSSCLCINH